MKKPDSDWADRAWRVAPDGYLARALQEALSGDGPALIDIAVDPSGYGDNLAALRRSRARPA